MSVTAIAPVAPRTVPRTVPDSGKLPEPEELSVPRTRLGRHTTLLSFLGAYPVYILAAWTLTIHLQTSIDDDLSRMANAYYILFSRFPHLAAVGFIWNPLPSLLDLPFIVVLKPLGLTIMAGPMQSSLWAACNVAILKRVLNQLGVRGWPCLALVCVYALNPLIVFYAADGMSESLFLTVILLLCSSMLDWCRQNRPGPLLISGIVCGIGFGVRYETIALLGVGIAAIAVQWWLRGQRSFSDRLEGEELAFIIPFAYLAGMWMFANWLIVGSPLYFQTGPGSNAAQVHDVIQTGADPVLGTLYHHAPAALQYFLERALGLMPGLPVLVLGSMVLVIRRRRPLQFVAVAFPLSVLAFHAYLLYAGQSFGFLRYYLYAIPAGVLAAGLIVGGLPGGRGRARRALRVLTIGATIAVTAISLPTTLHAMQSPSVGKQEHGPIEALEGRKTAASHFYQWRSDRAMAAYLDGLHLPDGSVVTDTTHSFAIILFSHRPRQFVVPSDFDFNTVVSQLPQFHGYVLVSRVKTPRSVLLNDRYPRLLYSGEPWAHLRHEVGTWLLYRIKPPSG